MSLDYNTCRWCKHKKPGSNTGHCTDNGAVCQNDKAFNLSGFFDPVDFYQDGHLNKAIKKGFNPYKHKFPKLEQALKDNWLDEDVTASIVNAVYEDLEDDEDNWVQEIESAVESAMDSFEKTIEGVEIVNQNDFSCKYFW